MGSNNIVIIGPRASGKTTYLASLAYRGERQSQYKFIVQSSDAEKLTQKAALLLKEGIQLEPTYIAFSNKT